MSETAWQIPPADVGLDPGEVHVWRVSLAGVPPPALARVLSPDERARADRFVYDVHRHRFVTARGVLRHLLGRYLGCDPAVLRFNYGPRGKPALAAPDGTPLRFNVSHSHELALVAVACGREVGVDVERCDPRRAAEDIAARFFAPEEVAAFRALPPGERVAGFFNAWTRKEAYMKATGQGLALGLDRFCVSLAPGAPPALLSTAWNPPDAARWSLHALDPGPGYAAALAVEGHGLTLRCFAWKT
ncbi:4'-phosphopantetheinyl transferase superfamily protein [Rhodocaloribacter litoris]|uniref:4'-phosphopantetheinyl transferase family protein n=1 Tax=Rhodocaloribacter litoris TaxID=2558931 RepID=UPI00141E7B1A|nr:4'-phosphopantetheinyl transferase superfamily protein [Rhodocaloribacter litoris]QXD15524.1 4'-phosphopantetheinyl transferase superfamily protein [Rhodocaloribacter litoris]